MNRNIYYVLMLFLFDVIIVHGQSHVVHYVPLPAQDLYNSFKTITDAGNATLGGPLKFTLSVVSSEDNNVIIYDHWEDG